MKKTIEKKRGEVKSAASHYTGHFFTGTMPCVECGAGPRATFAPLDDYDQTLQEEALRLAHHASTSARAGATEDAAGMFRDAARLLDLLCRRQQDRREAETPKHIRKAVRS